MIRTQSAYYHIVVLALLSSLLLFPSCNVGKSMPDELTNMKWIRIYPKDKMFTIPQRDDNVFLETEGNKFTIFRGDRSEEYAISRVETKRHKIYDYITLGYKIYMEGEGESYYDLDIIDKEADAYKWTLVKNGMVDSTSIFYISDYYKSYQLMLQSVTVPPALLNTAFYTLNKFGDGYALNYDYQNHPIVFEGSVVARKNNDNTTEEIIEQIEQTSDGWQIKFMNMPNVVYTIQKTDRDKSIYWTEISDRAHDSFLPSTFMIAKTEIDRRINKTLRMYPLNDFPSDSLGNITILPPIYSMYRQYIPNKYMSDEKNIEISTNIKEINEFIMYRASTDDVEIEVWGILEGDYNGDGLTDKLVVCEKSISEYGNSEERIYPIYIMQKQIDGSYCVVAETNFRTTDYDRLGDVRFENNELEILFKKHGEDVYYQHIYRYDKSEHDWLTNTIKKITPNGENIIARIHYPRSINENVEISASGYGYVEIPIYE